MIVIDSQRKLALFAATMFLIGVVFGAVAWTR